MNGHCKCYAGYQGLDCNIKDCINNCTMHGACIEGDCHCKKGFAGISCESTYISIMNRCGM